MTAYEMRMSDCSSDVCSSDLGVEPAQQPIEQFFAENGLQATVHETLQGTHYRCGNIELICGDIFGISAETLVACQGVYDRAALVALPPAMRQRYVAHVYGQLAQQYRGQIGRAHV